MALKHFIKDKYKSVGDALSDIRKELQRLQPIDSGSVSWEQTDYGMSAHSVDTGVSGSMPSDTDIPDNPAAANRQGQPFFIELVPSQDEHGSYTTLNVGGGNVYDYAHMVAVMPLFDALTITEHTRLPVWVLLVVTIENNRVSDAYLEVVEGDYNYRSVHEDDEAIVDYRFQVGGVGRGEDGSLFVDAYMRGDFFAPFTLPHKIEIKDSMNVLMTATPFNIENRTELWLAQEDYVDEGGKTWEVAKPKQHLIVNEDSKLAWEDKDIRLHPSVTPVFKLTDDGELAMNTSKSRAGYVVAADKANSALTWTTVDTSAGAALGVITVAGADDGSGTAKWAPITLNSDGSYTISGPSEDVILPEY